MKTIKCDRCGKEIPYVPLYMNVTQQEVYNKNIMVTAWDSFRCELQEVDLCNRCKCAVYDYIFNWAEAESEQNG